MVHLLKNLISSGTSNRNRAIRYILAALMALAIWCSALHAQSSSKFPDLSGNWVYGGALGRVVIKQSGKSVSLELTWTPNSDPSPHYKIDTAISGGALDGTWRCLARACNGQSGKFHAEISADASRLTISHTDDPGGTNQWNSFVLERAPSNAAGMAKALKDTGAVQIYDIFFDIDQAVIKPESKPILEEIAKLLKNDPSLKLEVAGHTDHTGSQQHNMVLSQARAQAVVQALANHYGIRMARLRAKGYGDTKPIAPNDTEQNRANNRRVELRKL